MYVPNGPPHCYKNAGLFRSPPCEAHMVAPKSKLVCIRVSREAHPSSQVSSEASVLVAPRGNCPDW